MNKTSKNHTLVYCNNKQAKLKILLFFFVFCFFAFFVEGTRVMLTSSFQKYVIIAVLYIAVNFVMVTFLK